MSGPRNQTEVFIVYFSGEYGGPWQAIRAGDMKAVFLLADTQKVLRAVYYEGLWFVRKGAARLVIFKYLTFFSFSGLEHN